MRRKIASGLGPVVIGLFASVIAGCSTTGGGQIRTLRFGTPTPVGVGTANLVAAIELGYFAEEGIEVEHSSYPTTVPVMNDVAAKKLDIGGGGVFPLVMANQPGKEHIPIKFFYNHIRNFAFEIVVLPDSSLNTISDLKGKRLGVYSLTAPYAPVTRAVFKENGLAVEDVELVPLGLELDGFELLESGEIDAHETSSSVVYEATGRQLKRLPYSDKIKNLLTYSYYAHVDTIKSEPRLLVGFARALAKGVLTCKVNPEWCVKVLWEYYPHLKPAPEDIEQELPQQIYVLRKGLEGYFAFPAGEPQRFGEYPANAFPDLVDVLYEGGELPTADIDTSVFYTNEFVEAINDFDVEAVEARARTLK